MAPVNRKKNGFILITMAVSIIVLLGMLGLAFDLGRSFLTKNEAQAFTDAAVMAAAIRLDGTDKGIAAAHTAVANSTNYWGFSTRTFSSVTTEFSTNKASWTTAPASGTGIRYVRVKAPTNSVTMYFLRVAGAPGSMNVPAQSTAGVQLGTSYSQGVFPFAPIAKSSVGPNFGYSFGDELTLLWPSSVNSLDGSSVKINNLCQADRNQAALDAVKSGLTAERGYIQETSASAIAAAIEDDHMDYTVTLGQSVYRAGGVKLTDVNQSLQDRVNQDSSPNTVDYNGYISGHDDSPLRRIVVIPIINDPTNAIVLGFARVFLPPKQPHNPNDSKCATYIGPADDPSGYLGNGMNTVRLLE